MNETNDTSALDRESHSHCTPEPLPENCMPCSRGDGNPADCPTLFVADRWIAPALATTLIAYLASSLLSLLAYEVASSLPIPEVVSKSIAIMSMPVCMMAAVLLAYSMFSGGEPFLQAFRIDKWRWRYIPTAVGLEAVCFIPLALVGVLSLKATKFLRDNLAPEWAHHLLESSQQFREFLLTMEWGMFVVIAIAAVIVAPILEEVIFRRILFSFLSSRIGIPAAFFAASFIFAAIHLRFSDIPTLFLLGCIWQAVFLYHSSLYPAIIYHAFHNLVAISLLACMRLGLLTR